MKANMKGGLVGIYSPYEAVFGVHPAALDLVNFSVSDLHLDQFFEARVSQENVSFQRPNTQVWPLISHHQFNKHSLFSSSSRARISEKILSLLLAYPGLVISDPTVEFVRVYQTGNRDASREMFRRVTEQLAEIEPLIDAGKLQFESGRPSFTDRARARVLDSFGVTDSFDAFAEMMMVYDGFQDLASDQQHLWLKEANRLPRLFGLKPESTTEPDRAAVRVKELWGALVHVSWQLAVCSKDHSADIALASSIEQKLFTELLDAGEPDEVIDQTTAPHFARVALGNIPNISSIELSIADALALRRDDSFEEFRAVFHSAMDDLDTEILHAGSTSADAARAFEMKMADNCRRLTGALNGKSFKDRVREAAFVSSLGVTTSLVTGAPGSSAFAAGVATGSASVIWNWARGRATPGALTAIRYSALLGNVKSSD